MELAARFSSLTSGSARPGQADLIALFDESDPMDIESMLGEWAGHTFGEDLPEEQLLIAIRWAGKNFRSADDVDPIVCFDESDHRFNNPVAGTAHLEMVDFRGALTAALVYDNGLMTDHFHRIDDKTALGAMTKPDDDNPGFFYLTRL